METKQHQSTQLGIMNALFYKFGSEAAQNVAFGSLLGFLAGAILKRPKMGLFGGVGLALGLTMGKYERAFEEVRSTKQFPRMEESYGVNYFVRKSIQAKRYVAEKFFKSKKPL